MRVGDGLISLSFHIPAERYDACHFGSDPQHRREPLFLQAAFEQICDPEDQQEYAAEPRDERRVEIAFERSLRRVHEFRSRRNACCRDVELFDRLVRQNRADGTLLDRKRGRLGSGQQQLRHLSRLKTLIVPQICDTSGGAVADVIVIFADDRSRSDAAEILQNPVPTAQFSVFYGTPGTEQNNRVRRLGGDDPEHFIGGIVFPRDEADGNGHVFFAFREHFLEIADLFFARRARLGNENDVFHVREYLCGDQCILIPEVARFDSGHVCFSRELQRKRSVIGGYEHRCIGGEGKRSVEKQIHGRIVAENDEIILFIQLFAERLHISGRRSVAEIVPHPDFVLFAVEHQFLVVEILLDAAVDVP